MGVTRISEMLGREKSQVSRALKALAEYGLVERNRDALTYRLGWRIYALAQLAGEPRLLEEAGPRLRRLAIETQERAHFSVLQGTEVLTLLSESPGRAVEAVGWVGRVTPAYCTSAGEALLFDHDAAALELLFADVEFTRRARNTPGGRRRAPRADRARPRARGGPRERRVRGRSRRGGGTRARCGRRDRRGPQRLGSVVPRRGPGGRPLRRRAGRRRGSRRRARGRQRRAARSTRREVLGAGRVRPRPALGRRPARRARARAAAARRPRGGLRRRAAGAGVGAGGRLRVGGPPRRRGHGAARRPPPRRGRRRVVQRRPRQRPRLRRRPPPHEGASRARSSSPRRSPPPSWRTRPPRSSCSPSSSATRSRSARASRCTRATTATTPAARGAASAPPLPPHGCSAWTRPRSTTRSASPSTTRRSRTSCGRSRSPP